MVQPPVTWSRGGRAARDSGGASRGRAREGEPARPPLPLGLQVVDGGSRRPARSRTRRRGPRETARPAGARGRARTQSPPTGTSTTSPGRRSSGWRRRGPAPTPPGRCPPIAPGSASPRAGRAITRSTISWNCAADHVGTVAGVDVVGTLAGQAVPEVVVGQQARDARRQVGGVGPDEGVLALDQVEALGADRRGDDRRVAHHRLHDLALHAGAVQQRHHRQPGAVEVGLDRRHPARPG